jgi:mono/diheme cytochrome c family protein
MPTRASGGGRATISTAPLHDGVNKRGQDMYPTMPYDFYTRVTRADVDAIYAYLRTVKPVRNAVDVNHLDFPFNVRMGMGVWRELYFNEGTYRPDPRRAPRGNRGAYLVEGLGHCSDCHSPRNLLGGIEKSKAMSGALIDGWFALTSRPTSRPGLGSWSAQELATYFKTGVAKDKTTTLGPMAEVIRKQPVVPHRRRPSGDGGIPQVPAAGFVAQNRARRARSHDHARRAALLRQLQRLPPVTRPRRPGRVSAAGREPGRARAGSEQHPEGRRSRHPRAQRLHRDAGIQHAAHRPAGRGDRELRAHELGQSRAPNATPGMVAKLRAGPN